MYPDRRRVSSTERRILTKATPKPHPDHRTEAAVNGWPLAIPYGPSHAAMFDAVMETRKGSAAAPVGYADSEDCDDVCWICLGTEERDLLRPCGCPNRFVHRHCLAKWQLMSAGREWVACRVCELRPAGPPRSAGAGAQPWRSRACIAPPPPVPPHRPPCPAHQPRSHPPAPTTTLTPPPHSRREERECRFCHQQLPDWRPALTPQDLQPASSVMSVKV